MKFVYIGCEGAPQVSTHYGVKFTIGEAAEVDDPFAIAKLSSHPHFVEVLDDGTEFIQAEQPKRRGRPRKVVDNADND